MSLPDSSACADAADLLHEVPFYRQLRAAQTAGDLLIARLYAALQPAGEAAERHCGDLRRIDTLLERLNDSELGPAAAAHVRGWAGGKPIKNWSGLLRTLRERRFPWERSLPG